MLRAIVVILVGWIILSSCTQKLVCPAFQSAYIYDKDELRKKFSYFNEDSTPKLASVSKTKYLIAEPVTYKQKVRSLKTVEAKPIKPIVPDSLVLGDSAAITAELDAAARSVIDSTYIVDVPQSEQATEVPDQDYIISVDREVRVLKYNTPDTVQYDELTGRYLPSKPTYYIKDVGFNVEQDSYLWYLRDVLILPDVRLAKKQSEMKEAEPKKEKKGLKGFFSGLFKKKKKQEEIEEESGQQVSQDMDDYNFDEFDDTRPAEQQEPVVQPEKKKGLKGLFKKKSKTDKKNKKTEEPPVEKKEEEEDDGFGN
jgi:hypothetical protein